MAVIAVDLGGTKLATAAFSDSGEMLERESVPLAGREGKLVADLIVERTIALVARHGARAAGVCVPGLYRTNSGTVWAPNIPGWDDYPLLAELNAGVGNAVRIVIDSDRAAYILGETWLGAARGASNAVFVAVGTGIGAGILCDGRLLRGAGDLAGAIGWLAFDRRFNERYLQHGCFEDQASGPGLVRVADDYMRADGEYRGTLRDADPLDTAAIFAAADGGDALALRVIDNAIQLWGMGAANLVSLFNPQLVIFGGGVFGPAARFIKRIRIEAERWAQPIAIRQVKFVASTLGGDAGLIGAGRLATLEVT